MLHANSGHEFRDGFCTHCREKEDSWHRIGVPCWFDRDAAESFWLNEVLSGGIKRTANDGQLATPVVKPVAKPKKAAVPNLFDGFDDD